MTRSAEPHTPQILWIGETNPAEFAPICAALAAEVQIERVDTLDAACGLLQPGGGEPVALILAQRWPGQFPADQVERLRRLAPLARWLALLGPWCEGEPRSGRPLPGVRRLYWHQWSPRVADEVRKLIRGEPCAWSLPETATEEDRFPLVHGPNSAATKPLVAIQAHDREAAAALADVLAAAGYSSVWLRPGQPLGARGVSAVVADLARPGEGQWRELAECQKRWSPAPVLALLGFPRPGDAARAKELGAAALLSKPLRAADLLAVLSAQPRPVST